MEIAAEILAHYAEGQQHARLTSRPSLELLRTRVLLERFLPAPPARVLDIGGASGVYASWLSGRGYQVHLIDRVPLHREQAMADGRFLRRLRWCPPPGRRRRQLRRCPAARPAVSLTDCTDWVGALAEARRVTRPGGIVAAAVISRYASTFDGFFRGFIDTPGFTALMTYA